MHYVAYYIRAYHLCKDHALDQATAVYRKQKRIHVATGSSILQIRISTQQNLWYHYNELESLIFKY